MNNLSNESIATQSKFAEQLRILHESHDSVPASIPDLKQWMQYWNDDESNVANLRNIRHWLTHAP